MKYQFVLEIGNWKPGFETQVWKPWFLVAEQKAIINWEKSSNLGWTAEPCRKPKTNNQQLLRNDLKLKLKYKVISGLKLRLENQVQTWKWKNPKWEAEFQVYFKKSREHQLLNLPTHPVYCLRNIWMVPNEYRIHRIVSRIMWQRMTFSTKMNVVKVQIF